MDTFSRLITGWLLVLLCSDVFGYGTVSSTGTENYTGIRVSRTSSLGNYDAASENAACALAAADVSLSSGFVYKDFYNANSPYTLSSASGIRTPGSNCVVRQCTTGGTSPSGCSAFPGFPAGVGTTTLSRTTCPASATASGGTCSCNAGYKSLNGTTCQQYTCSTKVGGSFERDTPISEGTFCQAYGIEGPDSGIGCAVRVAQVAVGRKAGRPTAYIGQSVGTGGYCNPNVDPGAPDPGDAEPTPEQVCALGRSPPLCAADLNGSTVCVVCDSSSSKTTETTSTPADSASAPTGITPGTKTTETTCTGSSCSTTTTTRDSAGNTTSTTTTSGSGE